jgi:hypothetical protein
MFRRISIPILCAATVAGGPALANQKAESIAVTPASQNAAIVFKSPQLPVPGTVKSAYHLFIMPYDAAAGHMNGGVLGGGLRVMARPKLFYDGYLVSDIKPGTYVIGLFSRQDSWVLCFNGDSRSFTIKPGEVLYLGDFDATKHVMELERLTITSGRTVSRNSQSIEFFDTVSPPAFAPVDEAQLSAVATMMKARMPLTNVAPRAAEFSPAKFGTGSDLFGLSRVCGGYYRKSAK